MLNTNNAITTYIKNHWHGPNGYWHMLRVALPLIASMGTSTVMQFTDRLFLSHYSINALAAAVPASTASLVVLLTLLGITGYGGVFIAHYIGAGEKEKVGMALWQSIYISIAGGAILILLCFVAKPLLSLGGADPEILDLEVSYFRVISAGGVFGLLGYSVGCFFTGRGKPRRVMVANVLATIINIPLNYILIFGKFGLPELGIVGAGLATVIAWIISFILICRWVFTREHDKIYRVIHSFRPNFRLIGRILRFGLPSGIDLCMEMLAVTAFVFIAGHLGREALAASNIAFTINSLAYTPMIGVYTATSILAGQAMGGKNIGGVERSVISALHLAIAYMIVLSTLFVMFPEFLIGFFKTDVDFENIKGVAVVLLRFVALYCLFDSFCLVYFGALKGVGDTLFPMFLMMAGSIALCLGCAIVLNLYPNLYAIWSVFTAYIGFMALGVFVRYKQGRWKRIRLI